MLNEMCHDEPTKQKKIELSRHYINTVDWDVNQQHKQNKKKRKSNKYHSQSQVKDYQ